MCKLSKQVLDLCDRAIELPVADRDAFLARACGDDASLRESVDSILVAASEAGEFLELDGPTAEELTLDAPTAALSGNATEDETQASAPAGGMADRSNDTEDTNDTRGPVGPSTTVQSPSSGGFRIRGKLGEGGMGVVWEAEQLNPKRRVALKVVRGGRFVDEAQVKMFQREADALARLKHPNIAAIYESGRTDDGQHFFAMELVVGRTLDRYLEERNDRTTREELRHRLALFKSICSAVHYAHQRGVIHRDLKPSNIVVSESDEDTRGSVSGIRLPAVKILDFGLARITDTDVNAPTMVSEVGMIKGTLPYMSPEQAKGDPDAMDVRTDVYALGVILYEMMSGSRPYETDRNSLVEAIRVICEERPRPLREGWKDDVRLDRDVATIVGKALEKDPDRRYASAAALAEDVERFLTSQPILARPASASYQIRKLIERNKIPASFAAAMLLALIGFGISMAVLYRQSQANLERALDAETLATAEAESSNQVAGFLETLFRESNPREASGVDLTARQMLEAGASRVEQELGEQPAVQARLMQVMGAAFRDLGQYDEGTRLLERAMEQAQNAPGMSPERVGQVRDELLYHYTLAGNHAAALPVLREILAEREAQLAPDDPALAKAMNDLAFGELRARSHTEDSIPRQRRAIELRRAAVSGPDHDLSIYLMNLGWLLRLRLQYEESVPVLEESLAIHDQVHPDDRPSEGWILQHLGWARIGVKDYDGAAEAFQRAVDINRRLFDGVHPEIAYNLEGIAMATYRSGDLRKAQELQRQAIDMQVQSTGEYHVEMADRLNTMVYLLWPDRKFKEASAVLDRAIDVVLESQGDQSADLMVLWNNRGETSWNRGRFDEALEYFNRSMTLTRSQWDRTNANRRVLIGLYMGKALIRAGLLDQAETVLREALELAKAETVSLKVFGRAEFYLADLFNERGDAKEAEALARESIELATEKLGEDHWHVGAARSALGLAMSLQNRFEEAGEELAAGEALLEAVYPVGDVERLFHAQRRVIHATRVGDSDTIREARKYLEAERAALPE